MKVGHLTLGCKSNSYDTEMMLSLFEKKGYEIVRDHGYADIFIINTCSVTNIAERKSRQAVERVLKLNPNAIIAVTGCYAQIKPQEVRKLKNVAVVVGTRDRSNIVELVERYITSGKHQLKITNLTNNAQFEDIKAESFKGRTRIQLKIQDGCNNFCSYCIIPYARGRICSKPMERVLEDIDIIKSEGIKEIVLTGIHIASYGRDTGKYTLIDLLENIDKKLDGTIIRIRLGSLDPCVITEDFVKRISVLKNICPQFHLSLQSGSSSVLKRMNRHYTAEEYENSVKLLRLYFNNPSITTDIIVGFPGETESEFEETLDFARKISFAKIHIFPYSKREGTVAAKMVGQIPHSVAVEREKRLAEIERETRKQYIDSFIGKNTDVLFEETKIINGDSYLCGYNPEYVYVMVRTDEALENNIREVKIIYAEQDSAVGEI